MLPAFGCQEKQISTLNASSDGKSSEEASLKPTDFSGERAFEHVRKQVEFGPRPAGSPAIKKLREYIVKELESYGLKTQADAFKARTPNPKFPEVEMVNLVADLPGEREGIIILASHYDTKWFADNKFLGANDGASSTGALLELARQLTKTKPKYSIWFVFFDGEESMAGPWEGDDHTYGSRHMAKKLRDDGEIRKVKAMILLDMIGDKDLNISREENSINWINDIIWRTAKRLGYGKHFPDETHYIEDDHMPFLQAGAPAVDLIDFNYGTGDEANCGDGGSDNCYWHTPQDTLDKVSAESLKIVGDTALLSLTEIAYKLN